jgi:hypothetical protein
MTKSSLKVERLTLRAQQRHAAVSGSAYSAAELHGSDAMQCGPHQFYVFRMETQHSVAFLPPTCSNYSPVYNPASGKGKRKKNTTNKIGARDQREGTT